MRTLRLAPPLALALFLTGCPGVPGISGTTNLDPKLVAVTTTNQITTATVTLSWSGITNAATYQVRRKLGDTGSTKTIGTTEKTTYLDQVIPGDAFTYTVQAFDAQGNPTGTATPESVIVATASVGVPSGLMVDGAATNANTGTSPSSGKPTLTWSQASGANAYYVTLSEDQGGNDGQVVYAALVNSTSATVGTLPQEGLTIAGYPQVKGEAGLTKGKIYFYSVTAIRTDVSDLSKAKAFDVATVDSPTILSYSK